MAGLSNGVKRGDEEMGDNKRLKNAD